MLSLLQLVGFSPEHPSAHSGSSTHSFEIMLSAFLLGLALGGLWIRRRIDQIEDPMAFLGWVQVVMGILALSTLVGYGSTFKMRSS
jgi:hypothetical protein